MLREAVGELVGARRQVLGQVVEDLRAVVRRSRRPSRLAGARRLDGVADVLAVAVADLADARWPSASSTGRL